jgi:hypothetical protein
MRHQRHIGLILVVPMSATICHIWGDNHTWHRSLQAFPQTTTWLITIIASYPGVLHIMYQDQQLLPLLTYLETVTCIPLQCRNTRMTHQHHLFLLDLNHHTTIPLLLLMPCQIFICLIYLHRTRSFGSGQSSQSRRSSQSLNSDRPSSGSIRQNDRFVQELQMEVALLRSENQSIRSEKDNLTYVITLLYIFL